MRSHETSTFTDRYQATSRWFSPVTFAALTTALITILSCRASFSPMDPTYAPVPTVAYIALIGCILVTILPTPSAISRSPYLVIRSAQLMAIAVITCLVGWIGVDLLLGLLRLARLIPLPLHLWDLAASATSLLLVISVLPRVRTKLKATSFIWRRASQWKPPYWVGIVGLMSSLIYPLLKASWALGGTVGTNNSPLHMEFIAGWGTVIIGLIPTLFLILTLQPKSLPRSLLVITAISGFFMIALGLPALAKGLPDIMRCGFTALASDSHVQQWVYLIVYLTWTVTGTALLAGTWRSYVTRQEKQEKTPRPHKGIT